MYLIECEKLKVGVIVQILTRFQLLIGFSHVLVTSRNSNVIRQVMVTCKSPSLTSDVGHLPVTSSYVTCVK